MVALVIVGSLLALIHYNYKPEPPQAANAKSVADDDEDEF
jgi:PTS system mannose-specific IIC component